MPQSALLTRQSAQMMYWNALLMNYHEILMTYIKLRMSYSGILRTEIDQGDLYRSVNIYDPGIGLDPGGAEPIPQLFDLIRLSVPQFMLALHPSTFQPDPGPRVALSVKCIKKALKFSAFIFCGL
ncbi:hypothetical protein A4D02_35875 [Niastella koreensis]|uniref:Uncharacterized protein n=2 Tax=Niastella koreensis TaxID=354356 RepID=G8THL8_NIAKG|nr:hypothetical protein Niako_1068 [Niastella koreensis GR20-10]OQP43328.1 hypothetical protein A4D02_35875 [Niastella koreensis]